MSLLRFLAEPDVAAKIKPLRPKLPRKIPATLKVQPRSNRFMTVGTAFDYLLRFELQRRAPHAVVRRWVAENAADTFWQTDETGASLVAVHGDAAAERAREDALRWIMTGEAVGGAENVNVRIQAVVQAARKAVDSYVLKDAPTPSDQAGAAQHAIRLGKLDDMCRASRFDPTFEEAAQEDVEDLLAMLAMTPFESLLHDKVLLLNPTFGETSRLVGGADTDLIAGDMLIDFKTTKADSMDVKNLDQLLGYFLLARRERQVQRTFPEIKRLALYFCRHAHLWSLNADAWTTHPDFPEVEQWFFKQAKIRFHA